MNRDQDSRDNTVNNRSRSQRRLALALLLILLLAGVFFFLSDSPGLVRYREILLGELGFGGEDDPEETQAEETSAGETETGMTVHWVTPVCDSGEIIAQFSTPLLPTDTAEDIAEKEHQLEMQHFPRVVEQVIEETFA